MHAILRRGNSAGAEGAPRFVRETVRKGRKLARHLDARIDAGLVEGQVLDVLDDEAVSFVGRIKNNARLDALAQPYLKRDPGRPTKAGAEFAVELRPYQAESWSRAYRVVLVVIDLPDRKTGLRDLFPHYFFLVTNWPLTRRPGLPPGRRRATGSAERNAACQGLACGAAQRLGASPTFADWEIVARFDGPGVGARADFGP
jgi:hypothetical protein